MFQINRFIESIKFLIEACWNKIQKRISIKLSIIKHQMLKTHIKAHKPSYYLKIQFLFLILKWLTKFQNDFAPEA
ncbi:unnamed protein product [Blepharisma stoltei]|uniref:Uncharacterized protein n=1 Tax=Blepharisma stoltei TaxID=1481888 RepID=A0AAU9IFL4_9CILI|nr:unnamed protein product [Blepharisma stoltei]